jgi:hypothetical protein
MRIIKAAFFLVLLQTLFVMFALKYSWNFSAEGNRKIFLVATLAEQPLLIVFSNLIRRREPGSIRWLAVLSILLSVLFFLAGLLVLFSAENH